MSVERRIGSIADVHTGYTFRQKIEHQSGGGFAVVQVKDTAPGVLREEGLSYLPLDGMKDRFFLKKGDVLFLAKGANNYALLFSSSVKAVAVSSFFVIRGCDDGVSPAYLSCYINSQLGQRQLESAKEGTYVTNITKKTLEEMTITIPSMEEQERIVRLFQLAEREKELISQLGVNRERLVNAVLKQKLDK